MVAGENDEKGTEAETARERRGARHRRERAKRTNSKTGTLGVGHTPMLGAIWRHRDRIAMRKTEGKIPSSLSVTLT